MAIEALSDFEFEDKTIKSVRDEGSGYSLEATDGWSLWCAKVEGIVPKAGDTMRLWGRGIGHTVRGIAINGRIVRYETAQEERDRHAREQASRDMERLAKAEANKAANDARVAALPDVFQRRIARFRQGHPDFWWQHQPYELFVCEQAVAIADALRPKGADAVLAFSKLYWKQQKMVVPALDDGHSGNTFGAACRLAHWYLNQPENVVREHGALTPLTGCDEYGCTHDEA